MEYNQVDIAGVSEEFVLVSKTRANILQELHLNEKDYVLYNNIIEHIENDLTETIREDKVGVLPTLGKIYKTLSNTVIKEHADELKDARRRLNKENYKEYVRELFRQEQAKVDKEVARKKRYIEFKKKVYPKYMKLHYTIGKEYADAWLYTMSKFTIVEHNQELDEVYAED